MKCLNCGAQLGLNETKCPYCNADNSIAIQREQHIENLQKKNEIYEEEVVKKSRAMIWHRIHKRINLGIFVFIIAVLGIAYGILAIDEYAFGEKRVQQLKEYYDNGQYLEMHAYMRREDIHYEYGDDNYELQKAVYFWGHYKDFIDSVGELEEEYKNNGYYDKLDVDICLMEAYSVLRTGRNDERYASYVENVEMVLLGYMQVPQEMLDEWYKEEVHFYSEWEVIEDHVSEVFGVGE